MVAFVIYLFSSLFSSNAVFENRSNNIDKYIQLSVEINRDTVSFDDNLLVTVVFYNKTNSRQYFYPKALLSIVKPSGGFEFDSYFLNKSIDVTELQMIEPKGVYKNTYSVHVTPPVFREGNNYLRLYYLCKKLEGDLERFNELYGSMESVMFKVYVVN